MYPLHSCFATTDGLVCKNTREFSGFEVSMNLIETFNYKPSIPPQTDIGLSCHSIPYSTDLIAYVDYRGAQVLETGDLDLIGNCSQQSYCDKTTHTCQPKRGMGSACQYNMECAIGKEYLPGHCNDNNNNSKVCGLRQDIPSFYYGAALRGEWKIGKHWKEAAAAVMVTGMMAACFLVGRHQASKLVSGVSGLIEKWHSREDGQQQQQQQQQDEERQYPTISGEDIWNQQHTRRLWWHFLPGARRMARAMDLRRTGDGSYVALDSRPTEPPPYRGD
ncbi:hypothetical protein BC941DRAFT_469154 [Chlamydoabsidia padenii]|nr:hypothetical protein BC941DRAFT_469154 [Chlamydoabsidia padenii]